jgi:RimJ/RimL family protein N-acetyltransferase
VITIVPASDQDFAALIKHRPPPAWGLAHGRVIAPLEVLAMLRDLADSIRADFDPAAWLIVEDGTVAGLVSLVTPVADRAIRIGYGVAPDCQGRGIATRAVGKVLQWAKADPRLNCVTAETDHHNTASHRVLERNGFARVGTRFDSEDGDLIIWQAQLG